MVGTPVAVLHWIGPAPDRQEATVSEQAPVVTHRDGVVGRITVGRGRRRNALDGPGWRALTRAVRELSGADVRAIVIAGHGDSFCAGSDMTEWVGAAAAAVEDSFTLMESAFTAVEQCPVPVVAKISGVAAGAGCQLALACDLRVMAASARIGMPIARLGILASARFAARLVELAGPALTRELLYTGRLLDAGTAVRVGLANTAVADADLDDHVDRVLRQIAGQPPAAVRAAKRAVSAVLRPGRDASERLHQRAVSEYDFRRGIGSFLDG